MERIELTFLGTGSAIPTKRRNHLAMLLKYKAENILIDCGEGAQRQFRFAGLNPCKVTRILISHWHGDHILGLPGLLQTLNLNGYDGELRIYGPKGSKKNFQEMVVPYLGFYWNISKQNGDKFNIVLKEVSPGVIFSSEDDEFFVEAFELDHGCPALGYSFVVREKSRLDKEKLKKLNLPNSPLLSELTKGNVITIDGRRVDGKKIMYKESERKVSFILDSRYNEGIVKSVKGADLLVSEATHSVEEQEIAKEYGHLTSRDAALIAKKGKVKGLALVHLSQRYEGIPKVILEEALEVFDSVIIPEDLESVEL